MAILILVACIITLILLITWAKLNVFLTFLIISLMAALLLGMPLPHIVQSINKGLGDMLGSLVIIIALGTMLGKLVGVSGAAQKVATSMRNVFGEKYITWAMCFTGFIVGIPLFYNVGFFIMVPMIFSVSNRYKLPLVYVGIPMLAALSVMHGFLPPHPSPTALQIQFHADIIKVFVYGLAVAIPAIIIAGPLFATTLRNMKTTSVIAMSVQDMRDDKLPGLANSILSSLLPVLLIGLSSVFIRFAGNNIVLKNILGFIGDPTIAMMETIAIATYTLGIRMGMKLTDVMNLYAEAIKEIAMVLLIIGSAGILKQIFLDSGANAQIAATLQGLNLPPLMLGWIIAAILRLCLGSATVAGLTAAGIIYPVMQHTAVDPNLMVLSIGAGSLFCSHVNDTSFWVTKEYFGLSMKQTFLSWSLMETLVSVIGLIGVLILNTLVR
ncbi:gluconate transporter [Mucilaginibacter corticis]|uniref:Gluconate transporter n=1 Tax=Mucilaginibacter corticis TaxID=2597670 RepID=A0A556MUP0_9SPHI|nr:gluconate:H+ symporter [Mucilaginibacter corticis]TSJ43654.1 gluconate transporter [Mucilaginibacter corticis]